MSEAFAVFLLMNNYFHDVASAMLLACGIVMWIVLKARDRVQEGGATAYASAVLRSITSLAWFSAAWIAVSGVIRIATIREFEWKNFVDKGIEAGLIAKYVIAAVMTSAGAYLLARLVRKISSGRSKE